MHCCISIVQLNYHIKTYLQFHYKHLNMLELYVRQDINKYLRILIY